MNAVEQTETEGRSIRPGTIAGGGILLTLGAAMLLDRTGVLRMRTDHLIAPMFLIVFGAASLINSASGADEDAWCSPRRAGRRRRGRFSGGIWLLGVGVWMLISQTHFLGLNYGTSWPIFIIMSGLILVLGGLR